MVDGQIPQIRRFYYMSVTLGSQGATPRSQGDRVTNNPSHSSPRGGYLPLGSLTITLEPFESLASLRLIN